MTDCTNTISILLVILCTMAGIDLWRQYAIRSESYWYESYVSSVKQGLEYWKIGFHLEDLEIKLNIESQILSRAYQTLRKPITQLRWNKDTHFTEENSINEKHVYREKFSSLGVNESNVVQIRCGDDGNLLKVGVSDYRTDPRDVCQIFTANSNEIFGPHYLFEIVRLPAISTTSPSSQSNQQSEAPTSAPSSSSTLNASSLELEKYNNSSDDKTSKHGKLYSPYGLEYSFGLKSLSNGNYVKAVGPPQDNKSGLWKLVISSSIPGFPERFRFSKEGYLFSPMIGGFLSCRNGEMVKGYEGQGGSTTSKFVIETLSPEAVHYARSMVSLSDQVLAIQAGTYHNLSLSATDASSPLQQKQQQSSDSSPDNVLGGETSSHSQIKICIAVPITSKGTKMSNIEDSPFWANLFDSFMKSVDWRSNKYYFKFYLGFDKADEMYDTGDSWQEIRDEFKKRATFRMSEQLIEDEEIEAILKKRLTVKLMHFDHLNGAPSQIVSQLVLTAYVDNFDYFYQVNDDTVIVTPNWAPKLISCLSSNRILPNLGVTGPNDVNNDKIFTHSFTHRTHVEVFGHLFPPSFKNWWSDDWISIVYGQEHTSFCPDVQIKHNVGAQKTSSTARYEVDKSAQIFLSDELMKGYVKINQWLKKNNHPRLAMPNICGYIPLVRLLARNMKNLNKETHGLSRDLSF